jgi:1,5-anhydro-D-fructose reductase (1,5-anhydro-D-mannitol-forming)
MTQQPVGDVFLRNADGEQLIQVEHESLYTRGVAAFCAAMRGEGKPSATAEDGVKSLIGALAVAFACYSGGRQVVRSTTI